MRVWWMLLVVGAAWGATPEERAVAHLEREAPSWFAENRCYSCHNNGDAARALVRARERGYAVREAALRDTLDWLRHPERWDANRGDERFSDKALAKMQFGVALRVAGGGSVAGELVKLQRADGAWPVAGEEGVSSPVTWGTALATALVAEAVEREYPEAARKGRVYLRGLAVRSTVDAAAVLLANPGHEGARRYLLEAVTSDGAWGPKPGLPGEVFDTAVALLALKRAGGAEDAVRRGRAWLAARQLESGGWPETTRPSGGTSYAQHVSTTAWALLALLETGPPAR